MPNRKTIAGSSRNRRGFGFIGSPLSGGSSPSPSPSPSPTPTPAPGGGISFNKTNFASVSELQLNGVSTNPSNQLRLTNDAAINNGSAFWKTPINTLNNWSTFFQAQITGVNGVFGGAGFHFVVQNNASGASAIGTGIGYAGMTNSLAVKFNTLALSGWKYNNSIEIYTNGDTSPPLNKKAADPSAYHNGSYLNNGQIINCWIDYNATTKRIYVFLAKTTTKPTQALMFYDIDLATLGANAYVGFAAGTGSAPSFNIHSILNWSFTESATAAALPASYWTRLVMPAAPFQTPPFTLYQDLHVVGRPDLQAMGFRVSNGYGQQQEFFEGGRTNDAYKLTAPSESITRAKVNSNYSAKPWPDVLWYLDIEELYLSQAQGQTDVMDSKKMSMIANWVAHENATLNTNFAICIYGMPFTDEFGDYAGGQAPGVVFRNSTMLPVVDYVSCISPDFYNVRQGYANWVDACTRKLSESRRLAQGKPVIAFLRPRYNANGETYNNQLVPGSDWIQMLNWCYANLDGVILWESDDGVPGVNWSSLTSTTDPNNWWYQTLAFKAAKGL